MATVATRRGKTLSAKKPRAHYESRIPLTPAGLLMEAHYTQISNSFDSSHTGPPAKTPSSTALSSSVVWLFPTNGGMKMTSRLIVVAFCVLVFVPRVVVGQTLRVPPNAAEESPPILPPEVFENTSQTDEV